MGHRLESGLQAANHPKTSSLSGRWMGHLLSYTMSGGHDCAMLPINPRGLNGPLTSHFCFPPTCIFTKYTNTLLISNAKLIKNEWLNDYNTPTLGGVMI